MRRRRTKASIRSASMADLLEESQRRLTEHARALAGFRAQALGVTDSLTRRAIRHHKVKPLRELLRDIMRGKQMRVVEAAAAAKEAGYVSRSVAQFPQMVHRVLNTNPKYFRRVSRGTYRGR